MTRFPKNRLFRLCIVGLIFFAIAIFINLSNKLLDPMIRFQSRGFWPTVLATSVLLVGYSYLITAIFYAFWKNANTNSIQNSSKALWGYLLTSITAISLIHFLFILVLMTLNDGDIPFKRYWKGDYPHLALSLLGYIWMVLKYPHWRMYGRKEPTTANSLQVIEYPDWKSQRNIQFLQFCLKDKLGYREDIAWNTIRVFDILCMCSSRTDHHIYLVNGEKISVDFTTTTVQEWTLGDWFFKTNSGMLVNMIHMVFPIANRRILQCNEEVYALWSRRMSPIQIDELLGVSKRLSGESLNLFIDSMYDFPDEGWEETIRV